MHPMLWVYERARTLLLISLQGIKERVFSIHLNIYALLYRPSQRTGTLEPVEVAVLLALRNPAALHGCGTSTQHSLAVQNT